MLGQHQAPQKSLGNGHRECREQVRIWPWGPESTPNGQLKSEHLGLLQGWDGAGQPLVPFFTEAEIPHLLRYPSQHWKGTLLPVVKTDSSDLQHKSLTELSVSRRKTLGN